MTDGVPEIRVDIKIAGAGNGIAARLYEIEKACFSSPWTERMLEESLEAGHVLTLTAEENGVIIGYAMAVFSQEEADIANLAVVPEYRKRGVGRALLQMLVWHLRQTGVGYAYLEVRASNEKARALYLSEGFAERGMRKNYYSSPKEDAVVMALDLEKEKQCIY